MIRRRTSGAITCPGCRSLVDVRARRCHVCGMRHPGFWGFGPYLLTIRTLPVHQILITWCVLLFVGSMLIYREEVEPGSGVGVLLQPTPSALIALGATGGLPVRGWGRWETLLTAVFLHGGPVHLLFNCIWIWQLSSVMLEIYGGARYFLVFLISGVVGNLAATYLESARLIIGASGGVFGIFGAFLWYGFKRGGIYGEQIFRFGLLWAVIGLALSFFIPYISLWAHLGGLFGGGAAAALLGYEEVRRTSPFMCFSALVAALLVVGAFVLHLLTLQIG